MLHVFCVILQGRMTQKTRSRRDPVSLSLGDLSAGSRWHCFVVAQILAQDFHRHVLVSDGMFCHEGKGANTRLCEQGGFPDVKNQTIVVLGDFVAECTMTQRIKGRSNHRGSGM